MTGDPSLLRALGAARRPLVVALAALGLSACLDPLVDDAVVPEALLPADAEVPFASGALAARIAELDQVDAIVPLRGAFASGAPVQFWDFGPAPNLAVPIWVIVRDDPDGMFATNTRRFTPVGQGNIIDAVPGDPGYSPYWRLFLVPVTDLWDGELVTSAEAIDAGVRAGLLERPISLQLAVNCPVVDADVRLEVGPGEVAPPDEGFYRGVRVAYFSFEVFNLGATDIATPPVYALRREGGEPLDETLRGVDMTGDGDRVDSNDVFAVAWGEAGYSSVVARVEVVVRSETGSIDTSGDDAQADVMHGATLLRSDGSPDPAVVIAFHPTGETYNRPQRPPPDGPSAAASAPEGGE